MAPFIKTEAPVQNKEAKPPPLYASETLASFSPDEERKFDIRYGLDLSLVGELVARSSDEDDTELHKYTPDGERFNNTQAYEKWYTEGGGKFPFACAAGDGGLAAFSWFEAAAIPETEDGPRGGEWDSVSFRSYPPHRGTGVMTDFATGVVTAHTLLRPSRRLWLKVKTDNPAAIRLYEKLGFTHLGPSVTEPDRLIMALPARAD